MLLETYKSRFLILLLNIGKSLDFRTLCKNEVYAELPGIA